MPAVSALAYQKGIGNYFSSESIPGSLPEGQNSPQKPPFGLYAEQLSGSAFTSPHGENLKTWVYRILPSVGQTGFRRHKSYNLCSAPFSKVSASPDPLRWDPFPHEQNDDDFVSSLTTICGAGDHRSRSGSAIHIYRFSRSMTHNYFYNADGELLIVPQEGRLLFATELGCLQVEPQEILVIPRGIKFRVHGLDSWSRGYVLENYGAPLQLPPRGPIGANGLANERDFFAPVAWYEDPQNSSQQLIVKFDGHLWVADIEHSPLNVVAWHGNYTPYKYDLRKFNTINSVSFDHPDPSIFTVLTSPTTRPGTANIDFVIFPPRWIVAEHTFRPPYYHRNIMSEYMGLIHGRYDAKPGKGFEPGGGSLHNVMSPHGPEAKAFESATNAELKPIYQGDTMAFMFESSLLYAPTDFAMTTPHLQKNYTDCWQGLQPARLPPKIS